MGYHATFDSSVMKNLGVLVFLVCIIGHIMGIGISRSIGISLSICISCGIGISHGIGFGYGISIGATMQNLAVLA